MPGHYLAKPTRPRWRRGHILADGARVWVGLHEAAGPPRDAVSNVAGVNAALGSQAAPPKSGVGPWGPTLEFDATTGQVQWPGRGASPAALAQFTIHCIYRLDSTAGNPRFLATGTTGGSLSFGVQTATGPLLVQANGQPANPNFGAPTADRWYGAVVAGDYASLTSTFWYFDYATWDLKVAAAALPAGVLTSDALLALNGDPTRPLAGAVSSFGYSARAWSHSEAVSYLMLDPAGPTRGPRRRLAPAAAAMMAPTGPRMPPIHLFFSGMIGDI